MSLGRRKSSRAHRHDEFGGESANYQLIPVSKSTICNWWIVIYALSVDGKSWQLTTVPSLGVGVLVGVSGVRADQRPATREARGVSFPHTPL